jgi:hypothetical protein
MDKATIQKYFSLGDSAEIMCSRNSIIGEIVDLSDTTLVIEDNLGNPAIVSLDSIISFKKIKNGDRVQPMSESEINSFPDFNEICSKIMYSMDEIYEKCDINKDAKIPTNAVVVAIAQTEVEVEMSDGTHALCKKAGFVGYSRENAAVGKRLLCYASKNEVCYASLVEMTYGELYERFQRAINTKPMPRTSIIGSVLYFLTQNFGGEILPLKKEIKALVKQLYTSNPISNAPSSRLKSSELTENQKNDIRDLIGNVRNTIVQLDVNERTRYVDNLIADKLGYKIRRTIVKSFLNDVFKNESSIDDSHKNEEKKLIEDGSKYVSATSEIKRYYPKYRNGSVTDERNDDIRFKDDVVIGEELLNELNNCWNNPIPVVCSYKRIDKHNFATFIIKPGTIRELSIAIESLKETGRIEIANEIERFLEQKGYVDNISLEQQLDISQESQNLLENTRRQRLIKNFDQAEKGFLELISRNYEYDSVVRDLTMMYQEWQGAAKSISFLEHHLPSLEDKLKTYNMLAPLYFSLGNKEKGIFYMEEALKLLPANTQTEIRKRDKLQKRIEKLRGKSNLTLTNSITIFSEDISAPLLKYDADNNTDRVLAFISGKGLDEKIQFIKERIGQLKDSPDLPAYYMAYVQLLQDSGYGEKKEIEITLANYCRAKARNFFNEGNSIAAREYLLQGISVISGEEKSDLYYILFISFCKQPKEVLPFYNNTFGSYEEIIKESSMVIEESDDVLYVILRIIARNSLMSRRMVRTLYEGESNSWLCDELNVDAMAPKDFVEKILLFAKQQESELISFEEEIRGLLGLNNAIEISRRILDMQLPNSKQVSGYDVQNITIVRELANYILDLENSSDYDVCEEICRKALAKANNTVASIERSPSRVSTLSVLPILVKQKDTIERALNKKFADTQPRILIKEIDDARPIGNDLEIQISIANAPGSSRADNGILILNAINGNTVNDMFYKLDCSLAGGANQTCIFTIKRTEQFNNELEVAYSFHYQDVRRSDKTLDGNLTFTIDTGDDYEDFENPFIAHVKSNAVKDKSMFKGRDEIIDTICKYVLEDYKGYVLYGQKRSGKSSVLYHITQRLRAEHKAFAVEYTMGNNIVQDIESEHDSMANLFYTIISEIGRAIKEVDRNVYKECITHIVRRQQFQEYPSETFKEYLDMYRDIIVDKLKYEQDKIVLIVDEFTYLYYHILEKKISPRIMEFWKGLVESRVFSFVFAGQDAMPRFMDEFQNVFASMHPQELTYIDEKSARELIEEPIWNHSKNCSRFHPDAVNEIIKLTACSPFYIMILCSELVKYARQRRRVPIQVSDVNSLVQRMICNESSISRKDFDNLISCGESRLDLIDKDDSIKVLKDIAVKSRNMDYYDINAINVFNKDKVKEIVDDLLRRGVLERHADLQDKVKIKVGLFKRWLLNHE